MPLTDAFSPNYPEPIRRAGKRRAAPFSLRLTDQERAELAAQAGGQSLSAFIKSRLFDAPNPKRGRRAGAMIEDRQAFAHALALLGKSELAPNVAALARAAETGSLPVDPDTEAKLLIAAQQVQHIRTMMMIALGLFAECFDDS